MSKSDWKTDFEKLAEPWMYPPVLPTIVGPSVENGREYRDPRTCLSWRSLSSRNMTGSIRSRMPQFPGIRKSRCSRSTRRSRCRPCASLQPRWGETWPGSRGWSPNCETLSMERVKSDKMKVEGVELSSGSDSEREGNVKCTPGTGLSKRFAKRTCKFFQFP
jgi:hypothetical protein